jgi:hypothetical protein
MTAAVGYQRVEGIALFLAAIATYFTLDYSFIWFVLLLPTVDISTVGYLINNGIGALVYNFGHSLVLPLALLVYGVQADVTLARAGALIWLTHIGMDRAFGYGLKLATGFKDTHLGTLGSQSHENW